MGEGNGALNGVITGFKLNQFTPSSSSNTINPENGLTVHVYASNSSYTTVYLPTLSMCRDFLGIGSSTKFAFEMAIIGKRSTYGFRVYGYVDSSHGATCPHLRNPDSYQDMTGGLAMAEGDTLLLQIVYDGSDFNAFIMAHMD